MTMNNLLQLKILRCKTYMIKLANAPKSIYDVISYGKCGMSILTIKLHTTKIVSCVTPCRIQLVERKSHTTCPIQLVEPKSYRVSRALLIFTVSFALAASG